MRRGEGRGKPKEKKTKRKKKSKGHQGYGYSLALSDRKYFTTTSLHPNMLKVFGKATHCKSKSNLKTRALQTIKQVHALQTQSLVFKPWDSAIWQQVVASSETKKNVDMQWPSFHLRNLNFLNMTIRHFGQASQLQYTNLGELQ